MMYTLVKGLTATAASLALAAVVASPLVATPVPPPAATVTLQNDQATPVKVYAEQDNIDQLLGTVGADATATLPVPGVIAWNRGDVVFVVHPKGGFDTATPNVVIGPGSHIGVLVPPAGEIPSAGEIMPEPSEPVMIDPHPAYRGTSITVRNDGGQHVELYAEHGAFDTRLGSVAPHGTATLDIPAWLTQLDDVVLLAEPRDGLGFASAPMRIRRGHHLGMIVPAL
jgi:hypothetical protein